jgi:hypothetical protein
LPRQGSVTSQNLWCFACQICVHFACLGAGPHAGVSRAPSCGLVPWSLCPHQLPNPSASAFPHDTPSTYITPHFVCVRWHHCLAGSHHTEQWPSGQARFGRVSLATRLNCPEPNILGRFQQKAYQQTHIHSCFHAIPLYARNSVVLRFLGSQVCHLEFCSPCKIVQTSAACTRPPSRQPRRTFDGAYMGSIQHCHPVLVQKSAATTRSRFPWSSRCHTSGDSSSA